MPNDLLRREEQRGTRSIFVWTAAIAIAVGIGLLAWFFVPEFSAPNGPKNAGIRSDQTKGISSAAQQTEPLRATSPRSTESYTVGRAEDLTATAKPELNMTQQQVSAIETFASQHSGERTQGGNFSIAVGAAVPESAHVQDIPPQLGQSLPSFKNDQYLIIGNQFLIIEKQTRRIVAIVPVPA
jgi:hypothetical protein